MNRDYLTSAIQVSLARAAWYQAYANSPANLARRVQVGGYHSNEYLCKSELIDDAMNTANTHLTRAQELLDQLNVTP